MQDNLQSQIYLTDLFLDCGNIIPFVIVDIYSMEPYFSCRIACALYMANDKKIISSQQQRTLNGKYIVNILKDDFPDIVRFFAKKELANLIKNETSITINNNFKLQECSLNKVFALTFAEIEKKNVRSSVAVFSNFNTFHNQLRTLIDFGGSIDNIWNTAK